MPNTMITYLNDHLAGATFAMALLKRFADTYPEEDLANFADDLSLQISEDRDVLEALVREVGGRTSPARIAVGWLIEKISRCKLRLAHGHFGAFEALETLSLGILGKVALWQALQVATTSHRALRGIDLEHLVSRAQAQHREVERQRIAVAGSALSE